MSFLNFENKTYLISGIANKKSVAYFVAKSLIENGAKIICTVQNSDNQQKVLSLFPNVDTYILDVEKEDEINKIGEEFFNKEIKLNGLLHSIAFANYSEGIKPFHETNLKDYLQASNISCFSLTSMSNALKKSFLPDASIVTISISNNRATNYGYMGPIKASLDASVAYLAKSFSSFSKIRFNAVCAGPLKTSASAGIPGYINNYLYAEELTLRKEALQTQEVANTVLFLLSSASSGINATGVVVDAGMSANYFDEKVVESFAKNN